MILGRLLQNRVMVELTSASPEASLDEISRHNLELFHVKKTGDLTVRFEINYRKYTALVKLCEHRGESLHFISRSGPVWYIAAAVKRPVLLIGILLSLAAAIWIPRSVYFIQVEGNYRLPDRYIIETAESCGISFGASRKSIRSEKVKNALLEKIPQLQWAGVNTRGCLATISVREKPIQEKTGSEKGICSIIAVKDGIITSGTALQGNLLCKEGQAVSEGQTLISAYTDCGLSIQVTTAKGEIFAQTNRQMEAVMPRNWYIQQTKTAPEYRFGILVGKKRINLWKDSGIWDASCDRMYEEYYVVLPGGFQLPIGVWVQTVTGYQLLLQPFDQELAEEVLKTHRNHRLSMQMVAGKVLHPQEHIVISDEVYSLQGSYICTEMIGVSRPEKIGEYYGQTN